MCLILNLSITTGNLYILDKLCIIDSNNLNDMLYNSLHFVKYSIIIPGILYGLPLLL